MEKINPSHFRVAIFGSARIKKDDPRYTLVHNLAKELARHNIDVVTGGGPGLMDAASRGHLKGRHNRHPHTIGLGIALPKEQSDSFHLDIKQEFKHFSNRLDTFMQLSDVVVVAPGGIGTLLELMYTWQLIQVHHICTMPVILIGAHWSELLIWIHKEMVKKNLMDAEDFDFIYQVNTWRQAVSIIKHFHHERNQGHIICTNYKKYQAFHNKH